MIEEDEDDDDDDGDITLEEDDEEDNKFFVSPVQIAFLRKEAMKRESNKRLFKYNLPSSSSSVVVVDDDDDNHDNNNNNNTSVNNSMEITIETIDTICNIFNQYEIIEIRGISKGNKKLVHTIATSIANTLQDTLCKPVVVVDIKGYAVRYYCPWTEEEEEIQVWLADW